MQRKAGAHRPVGVALDLHPADGVLRAQGEQLGRSHAAGRHIGGDPAGAGWQACACLQPCHSRVAGFGLCS